VTRGHSVAAVALLLVVSACGRASHASLPDFGTMTCAPLTAIASEASSLGALPHLAQLERAPIAGRIVSVGHGHAGAEPTIDVPGNQRATLARELRAAADAACRLRTPDDAQRAGYVRSATYTEGVGTHWTNWRLVDQPFDPARPSMLLYAPRRGVTTLVGFSYWVRAGTTDPPDGFTGRADHWHRHFGLCFDADGTLGRENVQRANECAGTWLNGSDLWMLHAWIVPGISNPDGVFAPLLP